MTREEAIEIFKRLKENAPNEMHIETLGSAQELFSMAIQALSQEPICDRDCEHCTWTECPLEPCDDAISRDAVLSKIKEVCFSEEWTQFRLDNGSNGQRDFIIDYIEQLPSVTQKSETVTEFADRCRECGAKYGKMLEQKSGKWIEKEGWDGDVYYECSVCEEPFCLIDGTPTDNMYNYCPNCGAKMVEPQERSE